ncbi:MAG: universal stress protein, partial [Chloroflexi bacterium]|nr:universal stress protein [Chloroflexota bacterium]
PEYSSFQINGRAEVLGPDDRRYRYCALVRRMFEAAPFHLPQPGYVAAYLVWVHEVLDKTPYVVAAPSSERFVPQVEPVASAARPAEVTFREVLVPVDNSSYSRWAAELALQIAGAFGSTVVSSHVYAARLHDRRFRDMEPGLPEEYQQPQVLAHQRAAHDTLIAQGLKLVSDSYLAMLEERCALARLRFVGKPSEGKNYA